jgi:restriction endonuclease S subunit
MEAIADGLGGLDTSITKTLEEVGSGSYSYFAEGDLLLAKVTPCFENGKKAIAEGLANGIGFATSEVHVVRPNTARVDRSYLNYLFSSEDFRAAGMATMTGSGGLRRVSESAILNYRLLITDLPTQKAIADFLDRETARIDHLIEKKRRLVGLLDERREATIAEEFRKNSALHGAPSVRLRRYLLSMCDGPFGSGLKSSHYTDEGVRVVRLQNIGPDHFRDHDAAFIDPGYYETLGDHDVLPGDLLVAGLGDTANAVGRACVAPVGLGPAMVKADCFRLRFDPRFVSHRFLAKYLSSPNGAAEIAQRAKGVTRSRINLQILARACYGLWAAKVSNRWSIRQAKATKCKPATVSGNRS